MERNDKELIEFMRKKYGTLWSISRVKTFQTCPLQYFLLYVAKGDIEQIENAYAVQGSNTHDILELFYTNKLEYSKMKNLFIEKFVKSETIKEVKFPNGKKESDKWFKNVVHFMEHHRPLKYSKISIENLVFIKIGGHCFRGYIDVIYEDEKGNITILDWKTSRMFKGKEIKKNGQQLIVYKLAMEHTYGVKVDKMVWNMVKYCDIHYTVGENKYVAYDIERRLVDEKKKEIIGKYTKEPDYEINTMLYDSKQQNWELFKDYNSFNFEIHDCIIEYSPTNEEIEECAKELYSNIKDILESGEVLEFYNGKNVGGFFCNTLCGVKDICPALKNKNK